MHNCIILQHTYTDLYTIVLWARTMSHFTNVSCLDNPSGTRRKWRVVKSLSGVELYDTAWYIHTHIVIIYILNICSGVQGGQS